MFLLSQKHFWYRIWFDLFHWKTYSWWRDVFYRYCVGCLGQWMDQLFIFPLDLIFDSLQWCYFIPTYMYLAAGIIEVPVNFTFLRSTCSTNIFTHHNFFVFRCYLKFTPVGAGKPCPSTTMFNMLVGKQPFLDKNHSWKTIFYGTKSCSKNNAVEIRLAKQLELTNAPTNPSRFSKG